MGGESSSFEAKLKNEEKKTHQLLDSIVKEKNEKKIKEKNEDFKNNLIIRVYSEEKCNSKYKNYLEGIKMKTWDIIYLDDGFTSEKTEKLQNIYETKSKSGKNFDEILMILIDSYESFISNTKNHNKNFLNIFNNTLDIEQQPFFLFINKNNKDFEYFSSEIFELDKSYIDFDKNCIDFISNNKEECNIEIYYEFEYNELSYLKSFLEKKKENKDNFNIILGSNEYIYNSQYYEEESQDNIQIALKNSKIIKIRNLDYNIKLEDDFEYLNNINEKNKVTYHFEYYKPKFKRTFDEFLSQYNLLDKKNFKVQYFCYSPFIQLKRICGYYHEYGDLLIKDKFAKYPSRINIGVCGRAGAGKSNLLNTILGEKRCLEGQGSSFITSYSHPKYPINFIDFPGLDDKYNCIDIIKRIRTKKSQLKEVKEEIHAMIYCIKFGERAFLDNEGDVIIELYNLNVKILFVFTKGERENSSEFRRYKNNFLIDLKKIFENKKIEAINLENDIKIVSINSMIMTDKKHGNTIKPFGIDTLFQVMHESLKDKKIPKEILEAIQKEKDEKGINELLATPNLIRIFPSRNELNDTIRNKVSIKISLFLGKLVSSYPQYYFKNTDDKFVSLWSDINNLISELSYVYCKKLDKDESLKLVKELRRIIKEFFKEGSKMTEDENYKEMKGYMKWYFRIVGIILSPVFIMAGGAAAAILSGRIKALIYQAFEEGGGINLGSYLYLFAEGFNEGIDGLEKISEEFWVSYNGH